MPRKKEKLPLPPVAALPEGAQHWLDQVVAGPMTAGAVEEVMRGCKKALIERAAMMRSESTIRACAETMAWIRGEREKELRAKGLISLVRAAAARRSARKDLEGAIPAVKAALADLRGRLTV